MGAALLFGLGLSGLSTGACGGVVAGDGPDGTGGALASGGSFPGTGGAGGAFPLPSGGTGGRVAETGGTGGEFMEEQCPDDPPPPEEKECEPTDPYADCADGYGCYPYFVYPYGERCGHPVFGAECAPASEGDQGDFCGDGLGYCSPGFMCVVGAAGGKRCAQICPLEGESGCPDGLVCGETDVQGYGVCF